MGKLEIMKVGLVQIGNKFGKQYYLPYSIGLVQSYLQNYSPEDGFDFLLPIHKYEKVETIIEYLSSADIVYSSIYIWNHQINLKIRKQLPKEIPIISGGPQIGRQQIPFDVPSPYLTGIFDPLMKANPDQQWIGLLETNRGCPFKCSFCYWGKDSGDIVK